ncbi:MAG: carboxypeptidase regulatory-like domain-containing protein [Bryobacterales bacterium]|nr:carboxypeptidase regulatory-like domain-containing protein [Bryobacterales bacterium]
MGTRHVLGFTVGITLLLGALRLPAQSTFATITGTVTDSTGATVPGVAVTATHLTTNLTASARTNEAGVYTLANLREGDYRLEAKAAGFSDITVDGISLLVRQLRRVDLTLQVASARQSIEVSAAPSLIETDTAKISSTRTARDYNSLPLRAQASSPYGFFSISSMFAVPKGTTTISFAGGGNGEASWSYDGAIGDNGQGGSFGNILNLEWIQEVKMDYVNNSAEYGSMAQIGVVGKSGTNDLHGSAFDYYSTSMFNARSVFATERASGVSHMLGFNVGGPVYIPKIYNGRNRTFFLINAQITTGGPTGRTFFTTVPTQAMRSGSFGTPIRNPLTDAVYMDGRIPASAISPVAKLIQERFYPLPNFGNTDSALSPNFNQTVSQPFWPDTSPMMRLDQRFGGKDYAYATYVVDQFRVWNLEGNLPTFGTRKQLRQMKVLNLTYSHTFRPTLLNELRFSHASDLNNFEGPVNGPQQVAALGLQGLSPDLPSVGGLLNVSFVGLPVQGLSQISANRGGPKAQHFQDQVSYFHGKHGIKFGGVIGRYFPTQTSAGTCLFGCVTFANTYTKVAGISNSGSAYADFLFGVPTSATINAAPLTVALRRWAESIYITDNWKISSRLTLDLGLRYEYAGAWTEANGLLSIFDPSRGSIVVPEGSQSKISPLMPASYVPIITANTAGLPNSLINGDKNNFAPRIGIAWRPFGNNTVFRGGYGIYYNSIASQPTAANVPFSIAIPTFTNTTPSPSLVLPQVFPAAAASGPKTVGLPSAINPNIKIPYTQQVSLTIEHQRWGFGWRASYVGTFGRQILFGYNFNSPAVDGQLFINKPRPFPNYPGITYTINGANHNYNALSLEVRRSMASGLQLNSSFTWARDIGNNVSPENPFDLSRERGVNQSIPTARFANTLVYELPVGRGRKLLSDIPRPVNTVIGGWQISTITLMQTGQFLTPTVTIPDPAGIAYTTSANRPLVTIRPDVVGNPNIADPNVRRWFDPAAFAAPPTGRFGNSSRGLVFGPGTNVWHASLQKWFSFSDNPRVPRLRVDLHATNVFNHPNWNNPNVSITSGQAGVITDDGGPNTGSLGDYSNTRVMKLALRVQW